MADDIDFSDWVFFCLPLIKEKKSILNLKRKNENFMGYEYLG